jgi:hypothetical protein
VLLSADDLANLSPATRTEIMRYLDATVGRSPIAAPLSAPEWSNQFSDIHMSNVEDITFKHVHRWMEGLPDSVRLGVRLIAEHGPVIEARLLVASGIDIRRFQSATTRRTRALTGDGSAYFLGWNHWAGMADPNGKYAVSPITHQSLRRYFGLPV